MENQKSIRESITKDEREKIEKQITTIKNLKVQKLMQIMLSMTFEELDSLKQELEKQGYLKSNK